MTLDTSDTIPYGQNVSTQAVGIRGDLTDEFDETFTATLTDIQGAVPGTVQVQGTILDDDPLPASPQRATLLQEGDRASRPRRHRDARPPTERTVPSPPGPGPHGHRRCGDFAPAGAVLTFPPGTTVPRAGGRAFGGLRRRARRDVLAGPFRRLRGDARPSTGAHDPGRRRARPVRDGPVVREGRHTCPDRLFQVSRSPVAADPVPSTTPTVAGNGGRRPTSPPPPARSPSVPEWLRAVEVALASDTLVEGSRDASRSSCPTRWGRPSAADTATGTILDPPGGEDFNQDGQTDLLWRHDFSGQNVLWYMNGTSLTTGTFTRPPPSPTSAGRWWARPTSTPTATPTSSSATTSPARTSSGT